MTERTARGASEFVISNHARDTWDLFIESQAHWRHSYAGQLEAHDVAGFATLLDRRQWAVSPEDWGILAAMWTTQRLAINEQVAAKLAVK